MYLKKYNLKNKFALVTGAGKGLGKACALALAEAGTNLILISRTKKDLDDVSKIGVKLGIKRRNRRSLPKDLQCLGRKIDGQQCTRSRRNGEEFCLSHMKGLPHGRIDGPTFAGKEKGKRGRKKKEVVYNEEEYLCVHLELIRGVQYLLDENDNVFTYNLEAPKFLGKREEIEAQ